MLKRILQGMGIGFAAAGLALAVWHLQPYWMVRAEAVTWDWRVGLLHNPAPSTDRIRLIFLDQYSLDWGKDRGWSWPWPRQVYEPVLEFCKRGGAKAVAFDVIFSEPSGFGVEDDALFGNAIASNRTFVGTVFVGGERGGQTNWPAEVAAPALQLVSDVPERATALTLPRAAFPIPEIATNAALLATVFGNPDRDGVYRRLRPLSLFDGKVVPSLGLAAYLAPSSNRVISLTPLRFTAGEQATPLPLDADGNVILHYRGPSQTHKTVNVAAVIESELSLREGKAPTIDPLFFKDTYVFFGFTAPGLFDLKSSPVAAVYPGVEVHATFLDNLLAADFMRDASGTLVMLWTVLLAVTAAVAVRLGRSAWQNVLAMVILLPMPMLLGLLAYTHGVWLPMVAPFSAVAPALVGALAVNFATEGRQKRFIKGAFKQYLSPVVIEELVQHPERLKLGGETRELSIFFSDVRGFTGISERLTPQQLTGLLNDYLTAMTDVIYKHGGTVDKYEGDAIIAFWNAPLAHPNHAVSAVRAALECQSRLAELRPVFERQVQAELHQRIGLNSGPVVVGNMGSRQRFNYTFLGDAGNLAARLEGINKQFGTSILISESTRRQLDDTLTVREIARVQVVGRKEAVRVFEPLSPADAATQRDLLDSFGHALTAYYAGRIEEALALFSTTEARDPVSAAYVRRCRALVAQPPTEWNGIWIMTEK
jgi:adenylate cyclase